MPSRGNQNPILLFDTGETVDLERLRARQEGLAKLAARDKEIAAAREIYDQECTAIRTQAHDLKSIAWSEYQATVRQIERKYRDKPPSWTHRRKGKKSD